MTYAQRATAGERHATLVHELDHGVLNHLGVDREGRDSLVFTHATEHGVGYVAHTALEWQERLRQTARLHLAHEEVRHVAANGQRDVVQRGELAAVRLAVRLHHADDLLRVDLDEGLADAV